MLLGRNKNKDVCEDQCKMSLMKEESSSAGDDRFKCGRDNGVT